jgi:hypothetical protein
VLLHSRFAGGPSVNVSSTVYMHVLFGVLFFVYYFIGYVYIMVFTSNDAFLLLDVSDVFSQGIWAGIKELNDPDLRKLAEGLPQVVMMAREDGTVKQYMYGFRRWKTWTQNHVDISCLPADSLHVALYLVSLIQSSSSPSPVLSAFLQYKLGSQNRGFA